MQKQEILQRVQQVLCPKYLPAGWKSRTPYSIGLETDLINDIGMDPLEGMDLILDLESQFNFSIPDEDVDNLFGPRNSIRESISPTGKEILRVPVSAIVDYIYQRLTNN